MSGLIARRLGGGALVATLLLSAPAARAEQSDVEGGFLSLDVHGFGSQGFLVTTGNEYLVADSKRGSFQFSEIGLNFSKEFTSTLRFGVQFFAQNFGAAGNYIPQIDWFQLDYRWRDFLGLRVGRLKIPHGLYNEVNDIDSGRVPVLLPQSVYPLQARSFLFAQTGAELYGFVRSPWAGALEYRVFGGTIFIDPALVVPVGAPLQLKFNVPYSFGGRLLWETPLAGLRVGGSVLDLRLDTTAFLPMSMTAAIKNDTVFGVASVEWTARVLTLTAEYSRGHSKQESVVAGANLNVTSESGYLMANVVATPWLQPGLYYSVGFPDVHHRTGLANQQHDLTATLRFDINRYWLVKLEGHYMVGTAGLNNPLRVGPPPTNPANHWAVFLIKTTIYF
jgi:hypothetical protein